MYNTKEETFSIKDYDLVEKPLWFPPNNEVETL
jgi:hypothetical protein